MSMRASDFYVFSAFFAVRFTEWIVMFAIGVFMFTAVCITLVYFFEGGVCKRICMF